MSQLYQSTYITKATKRDIAPVFNLVNLAYKVEIGSDGVCYKNCDKYVLKDQTRKQLGDMWLLRNHRQLLGCVCAVSHKGAIEVTVLAVHPDHQGKGYGAKLMDSVETRAKEKVSLGVPSCRSDIMPFFIKRGYKPVVSKSIDEMRKLYPEELNEETLTRGDIEWTIFVKKLDNDDEEEILGNVIRE